MILSLFYRVIYIALECIKILKINEKKMLGKIYYNYLRKDVMFIHTIQQSNSNYNNNKIILNYSGSLIL